MSTVTTETFNERLRAARRNAGYDSADDAWAALKAIYRRTPSISTFRRWETVENVEQLIDPGIFGVYCREILRVPPHEVSIELGDLTRELVVLLGGNHTPEKPARARKTTARYSPMAQAA